MAVTLQGSTLNNIHIGNSGGGGGGAISAVNSVFRDPQFATSSPTYVSSSPALSISVTTGTKALVTLTSYISTGGGAAIGVASLRVSGATSVAAGTWNIELAAPASGFSATCSRTFEVSLNAGLNTFEMQYKSAQGTPLFGANQIVVQTLA